MEGFLVSFEGQDASGKSKLLKYTEKRLKNIGVKALSIPEFSDNVIGKFIKSLLEEKKFIDLNAPGPSALTETMYILSDLYYQDELEIKPLISKGFIVLKERHLDSVFACQIPKIISDYPKEDRNNFFIWLTEVTKKLTIPEITFFLDVEMKIIKQRIVGRGETIYKEDVAVFSERQKIYNVLASKNHNRWYNITNNLNIEVAGSVIENIIVENTKNKGLI